MVRRTVNWQDAPPPLRVECGVWQTLLASKLKFRVEINRQMDLKRRPIKIDKAELSADATSVQAWGHCIRHSDCVKYHFALTAPDSADGAAVILVKCDGDPAVCDGKPEVRTGIKQQTRTQREIARESTQARPPLAAASSLLERSVPPSEFPDPTTLVTARKRANSSATGSSAPTRFCQQWQEWLQAHMGTAGCIRELKVVDFVYRPAAWPDEPPEWFPLSWLHAGREVPRVEGACICISGAMFRLVEEFIRSGGADGRGGIYMVHDLSFKRTAARFGLAAVAIPWLGSWANEWRCSALMACLGWGPKDNKHTWLVLLVTVLMFYHDAGLPLWQATLQGLWDDTAGGRLAHDALYGTEKGFGRCLRHQVARLEKLPPRLGGAALGEYCAGTVEFVANLGHPPLFHEFVDAHLAELVQAGKESTVKYLSDEVYTKRGGKWTADWACWPSQYVPGLTPASVNQGLESFWDTIKDGINVNTQHTEIGFVTKKVETAYNAMLRQRGFLVEGSNDEWALAETIRRRPIFARPCDWTMPSLLSGKEEQTRQLPWEENEQRHSPPACAYLEAAPANFKCSELRRGTTVAGLRCKRFYTVPVYNSKLEIDRGTHEAFLSAHRENDVQAALRDLRLYVDDDRYPSGQRLSQSRFRNLFTELCGALVLERPIHGHTVVCLCRSFFPRRAQCNHELWLRSLEGDSSVELVELARMTEGEGTRAPSEFRSSGSAPGAAVRTRGHMWSTLDALRKAAQVHSCNEVAPAFFR